MATEISEAEARAFLESNLEVDSEPTLSFEEVDRIVAAARRTDSAGAAPDADGWVSTFDLNAAVKVGARLKARKCASAHSFSSDGQSFSRAEMFRHWTDVADGVRSLPVSVPVSAPWVEFTDDEDSWA